MGQNSSKQPASGNPPAEVLPNNAKSRLEDLPDNDKTRFTDLPDDIFTHMTQSLDAKAMRNLARVNQQMYAFFQPVLQSKSLLKHVAFGEQDKAERILKAAAKSKLLRQLLIQKNIPPDVFDRPLNEKPFTAFQEALRSLETIPDEICHMMKPYFEMLGPEGLQIMQAQFDEIYPPISPKNPAPSRVLEVLNDEIIKRQFNELFPQDNSNNPPDAVQAKVLQQLITAEKFKNGALQIVLDAINATTEGDAQTLLLNPKDDTGNTQLHDALKAFRDELMQLTQEDDVFNPFLRQVILKTYLNRLKDFEGWWSRSLYCVQLYGFAQALSPVDFLQADVQGPYLLVKTDPLDKLMRTLSRLKPHSTTEITDLPDKLMRTLSQLKPYSTTEITVPLLPFEELGFNYVVTWHDSDEFSRCSSQFINHSHKLFKKWCQTKNHGLAQLYNSIDSENSVGSRPPLPGTVVGYPTKS